MHYRLAPFPPHKAAGKRGAGFETPLFPVGVGIEAVQGQMLSGDEAESFSTFHACDGFFPDGMFRSDVFCRKASASIGRVQFF